MIPEISGGWAPQQKQDERDGLVFKETVTLAQQLLDHSDSSAGEPV